MEYLKIYMKHESLQKVFFVTELTLYFTYQHQNKNDTVSCMTLQ